MTSSLGVPPVPTRTERFSIGALARRSGVYPLLRSAASIWPLPVRVRIVGGREMFVDLRSAIGRGLYAKGEFDMKSFEPGLATLTPGACVLDIGANIGFFTMLALDQIGQEGRVFCFEIDPRPLRVLKKTISTFALRNVDVVETAVFNKDGFVSFAPNDDHGNSQVEFLQAGKRSVRAVRLDTWVDQQRLDRIDLIKIDVEGAEKFVLEGGRETIARFRPVILCEASYLSNRFDYDANDLAEILKGLGYSTEWLQDVWSPTLFAKPNPNS